MSFYSKCMRNASLILFWLAIFAGVGTTMSVISSVWDMVSSGVGDVYQPHGPRAFYTILSALVAGISSAIWPFIGASVLWLLEKRLPKQEAAE